MPTSRTGVARNTPIGATLMPSGVAFRLWAPAAREVFVLTGAALQAAGQAGFQPTGAETMFRLGDDTWGAFISGLSEGAPYRFWVVGTGSTGLKRDPRARELSIAPAYPD